ncbi:hypothetical protein MA16_Dca022929 [Dendrobium catenatum]|uniref:Uncharacterized protein n=1 Tax=Dendrobium catenatum TaxID=906689 RepID=A0A2I0VPF9_9ASPA|nr:hypothetical protein MA16_Dca022929 [Dendrobium catenatum]
MFNHCNLLLTQIDIYIGFLFGPPTDARLLPIHRLTPHFCPTTDCYRTYSRPSIIGGIPPYN